MAMVRSVRHTCPLVSLMSKERELADGELTASLLWGIDHLSNTEYSNLILPENWGTGSPSHGHL